VSLPLSIPTPAQEASLRRTTPTPERPLPPLRILVVDDLPINLLVAEKIVSKTGAHFVTTAANGQEALDKWGPGKFDAIFMDVQMPIMDGITTLPEIKKLYPNIRVIMLTMHNDHSMITKLMELGANSYLTKNSDPELIYEAIKTVHEEEYFFNQLTNKALIDGLKMKRQIEVSLPVDAKLSEKEIAILRMICEEKSTKEIADIVELSPRTVEAIRDKLKVKTGAKSMAGLVMYAVKSGIIHGAPETDS
jgi:DNA-binding NarL/FixJ family response regulator